MQFEIQKKGEGYDPGVMVSKYISCIEVMWNEVGVMPNRRQKDKPRSINRKARPHSRIISEADDMADEIRMRTRLTAKIIRAAKPHLGSADRLSDDLAITNILSDLRHYCDYRGIEFE